MARVGIITGVLREAASLSGLSENDDVAIRTAGADPRRAGELASELFAQGAQGVLSFGLCGGLDPALEAGDLIIPARIISGEGKSLTCDPDWTGRLEDALDDMLTRKGSTLAHSSAIVAGPRRKSVLRANTGADAVDMESYAVGLAARKAGKPFAVIRAVSDTADTKLPDWTDEIVSSAGGTDGVRLLKNLARHPGDIGKLLTLGRGSTRALKVLRRVAEHLGPGFAFLPAGTKSK
jgi:adenosylhomocysteine nucleosidase